MGTAVMVWQEKRVIDLFVVKWKVEVMQMGWWLTVREKEIKLMNYKCYSGFKFKFTGIPPSVGKASIQGSECIGASFG